MGESLLSSQLSRRTRAETFATPAKNMRKEFTAIRRWKSRISDKNGREEMQEYAKKKLFDRCHLLFEEYLQGKENHAEKQQMFGGKSTRK